LGDVGTSLHFSGFANQDLLTFGEGIWHRDKVIDAPADGFQHSFRGQFLGISRNHAWRFTERSCSATYERVLILHDQPSTAAFHNNKCSDTSFILVLDPIRCSERARPTSDRYDRHIAAGEPHRKVFDRGAYPFQERGMEWTSFSSFSTASRPRVHPPNGLM
jgi:hypothetical protein